MLVRLFEHHSRNCVLCALLSLGGKSTAFVVPGALTGLCRSCVFGREVSRMNLSYHNERGKKGENSPKSLFDAPNVIPFPIPLNHILLPHGHTGPSHPHIRNVVQVILIEPDLQRTHMTLWPLTKSPFLDDQIWFFELSVFACYITVEKGELGPGFGAFENSRRSARECGYPLRVGEGLVHLFGCGTEFVGCSHCCGVDRRFGVYSGCGGGRFHWDGILGGMPCWC